MKLLDGINYVETGVCKLDVKKVARCFGQHSTIAKHHGKFTLLNQRAGVKCQISADDANWLIGKLGLVEVQLPLFRDASTFMMPWRRDRVLVERKLPDLLMEVMQFTFEISQRAKLSADENYELHKMLADGFKGNLGIMSVGTKYYKDRTQARVTNYDDTRCWDCQMETSHQKAEEGEWYMVWPKVWKAAKGYEVDFLCIGCLEKRLGRQLTPADFSDVPLNVSPGYRRTKRLQDRMGINFA